MTSLDVVERLRTAGCVWAEEEAALLWSSAGTEDELEQLVTRRVGGEPLELVLGWAEFLGRRLVVAPGVFVPRRRTELLARTTNAHVAARAGASDHAPVVLVEMCCGVAPVASCVDGTSVVVHAADVDPVALECARANAPAAVLHLGDLFDALPPDLLGRVGVMAANAPYVPTDKIASMPPEARDHEPHRALDGGVTGVDLHRRLAADAADWLGAGGVLLIETSASQAGLTTAAMAASGLATEIVLDEEIGGCVAVGVKAASTEVGRAAEVSRAVEAPE